MKRFITKVALVFVSTFAVIAFSGSITAAQADAGHGAGHGNCGAGDGSLEITSPLNNAFINGDSVKLEYTNKTEGCADHIHFYVDDTRVKPFDGTFRNLTPGQHKLRIFAATKDHKAVGPDDYVLIHVR